MGNTRDYVINHILNANDTLIQLSKSTFLVINEQLDAKVYQVTKKRNKKESKNEFDIFVTKNFSLMNVRKIKKFNSTGITNYLIDDLETISIMDEEEKEKFENMLHEQHIYINLTKKKRSKLTKSWIMWSLLALSLLSFTQPIFILASICIIIIALATTKTLNKKYLGIFELLHDVDESISSLVLKKKTLMDENNKLINKLEKYESERMDEISKKENELKVEIREMENSIGIKTAELYALSKEIKDVVNELNIKDVMVYNTDHIESSKVKDELSIIELEEKELIKGNAVITSNNHSMSKKELNDQKKQILRSFNTECEYYLSNVNVNNIDTYKNKVVRAFETLNRIYEVDNVQLSKMLLKSKLKRLNLVHSYAIRLQEEKELQKAAREQLLEEKKVQREIEKQKKEIDKEEKHFNKEITKLMQYLNKSNVDVEKNLYLEKIKELEGKLSELEKDKKDVENREANTRAGYVYVISNIGSFGENIYKIGVTRRLEPMDRVKELGDASVPFEFDVHAMIFSDDAPKLENTLHQYFRSQEVNKINHRKEFFNVSLDKIEEVVKQNHNDTVEFIKVPVATQYRESLQVS